MLLALLSLAVAAADVPRIEALAYRTAILYGSSCNVIVVAGPDGLLLVDDQRSRDYDETRALLASRYALPVREIINTHWHLDHAGGNAQFARDGAVVLANENVRTRLSASTVVASYRAKLPGAADKLAPTVTYGSRYTVRFGKERLVLVHVAAAHTDGDTLVKLTRANALHMGDIFFNGLYPHIDTDTGGSIQGNIRALDAAIRVSDERTRIVPGHGAIATRGELRAYRAMLAAVASNVRAQIRAGHSLEMIVASKPAASYRLGGDADQFVTAVFQGYSAKPA